MELMILLIIKNIDKCNKENIYIDGLIDKVIRFYQ
jgi:hypothetical protein